MTFNEARDELKRISKGEYRHLSYRLTDYCDKIEVQCQIYCGNGGLRGYLCDGKTWEEALGKLRDKLNPPPIQPPNLEEAPE